MSVTFSTKRPRQPQAGKKNPGMAPSRAPKRISSILKKRFRVRDEEEGQYPKRVKRITSSSGGGNSRRRKLYKPLNKESRDSKSVDTPSKKVVLSLIS